MFFVVLAVPLITRYQCRRLRTHDSMLDSRQRGNGWKAPTNIRSVQAKAQCLEWEHACCPHVMPSHRRGQKNIPRLAPPQPPPPSAVVGPMVLCSRRRHCHRRQSRPPDIRRRSHRRPRSLPAATRRRRPAAACGLPPWILSSRDNACRRRRAAGVCNSEDKGSASTFPIAHAPTAVAPLTPSALTRPAGATSPQHVSVVRRRAQRRSPRGTGRGSSPRCATPCTSAFRYVVGTARAAAGTDRVAAAAAAGAPAL